MSGTTLERASHRWREILPLLGVDTRFLTGRHGPCPLCGGRDRFRFDDRDGTGSYYCNQCGAGVGIILVRKVRSWDFQTACAEIDRIIGADGAPAAKPPGIDPDRSAARRIAAIERLLREARQQEVVDAYLSRRGLGVTSPILKGHARCPYFDDDNHRLVDRYPAVVAPILGPDGKLQSAMRIYDADVSPRKKTMPVVDTLNGAAIPLFEIDDANELGVGEGIETCLAAYELFEAIPVWSALSANGIKAFEPPPGLKRLVIFADNDANYTGQAAAYSLAARLHKQIAEIKVEIPPVIDAKKTDWLDVLNEGRHGR